MKKISIFRLVSVIFALTFAISLVTYAKITQNNIAESVLRLHVVAHSDSESDQKLKIAVRDRILNEAGELFENAASAEAAKLCAKENLALLEEIAKDEIRKRGYSYAVKVEIGDFSFPVKFYDDIMLPSGRYTAVRITLGEGNGRNWWCVMYPPMCSLDGITMDKGREKLKSSLSGDEYKIISSANKNAEIRFKIVDIINSFL